MLEQLGPDLQVCGIGVGSPGPLSVSEGCRAYAPNLGWDHVPIRQILKDEFGVRVEVGNDANVAGLAEWRFSAGEQCRNMIYVTVSTGIGGESLSMGSSSSVARFRRRDRAYYHGGDWPYVRVRMARLL